MDNYSLKRSILFISITIWLILNLFDFSLSSTTLLKTDLHPIVVDLGGIWKAKSGKLIPANQYLPDLNDSAWHDITVPSNWYLQGYDYTGIVWYRRNFSLALSLRDSMIRLQFEGVDYSADIWLNGNYIGFHEGYFQPFSFDISKDVIFDKDNQLTVRVNSPLEDPGKAWSLKKQLIKGIYGHHDTRPGGAWSVTGQDKNTGGIWAPVTLHISQTTQINSVDILPVLEFGDTSVTISSNIFSSAQQDRKFQMIVEIQPYNFSVHSGSSISNIDTITLNPGENSDKLVIPCSNIKLWWPMGYGEQHLYKLVVKISKDDTVNDCFEKVFGFRTVECDPKTSVWRINGRKIFLRGTNYISSQWLTEMTREKYELDIALMKKANINAVRVHVHIEANEFYDLCDEAGLLIWQDFPLQWGYANDRSFIDRAKKQAIDMVNLLNRHPSVITWTMHNEPPWDSDWMKYKYSDYNPNQNIKLDDELFACISEFDRTRPTQKHSAGVQHPWFGWYSGTTRDYEKPTSQAFITEFGAQALPRLTSLRKIFDEEELWPSNDEEWSKWDYHNFQRRETFDIAKVEKGKNIFEFITNTQDYQAHLVKLAAESYRRQKYDPVTAIFQFMFVENWPSVNWGILDYWRNPKPGYDALSIAYQPVLPMAVIKINDNKIVADLWVVNDKWIDLKKIELSYTITDDETTYLKASNIIDIGKDSAEKYITMNNKLPDAGKYMLIIKLTDAKGNVIGYNDYPFTIIDDEK
jgi:beta-mannosidase